MTALVSFEVPATLELAAHREVARAREVVQDHEHGGALRDADQDRVVRGRSGRDVAPAGSREVVDGGGEARERHLTSRLHDARGARRLRDDDAVADGSFAACVGVPLWRPCSCGRDVDPSPAASPESQVYVPLGSSPATLVAKVAKSMPAARRGGVVRHLDGGRKPLAVLAATYVQLVPSEMA